jgi:chorismate synthase
VVRAHRDGIERRCASNTCIRQLRVRRPGLEHETFFTTLVEHQPYAAASRRLNCASGTSVATAKLLLNEDKTMRGNTFGNFLTLTTFGESHGVALGAIVDGCPAGIELSLEDIQRNLNRRRPGQSKITTSRGEKDAAEILSGVFEGKTLGSPICVVIRNHDARSKDYDPNYYRAGHADRVWDDKYGHRDYRGGGRASGRETIGRVIGGSVAEKILPPEVSIVGFTRQIGTHRAADVPNELTRELVDTHATRMPDHAVADIVSEELLACKEQGDSRGGIVEVWVDGLPSGLGEPVFLKAKNVLANAVLSVGAVVGVTLGDAPEDVTMRGVDFHSGVSGSGEDAGISPAANGIQGGITNGERIRVQAYFKPASTVGSMATSGRHDPCIVPRAVPVIESMVTLALADLFLASRIDRIDNLR